MRPQRGQASIEYVAIIAVVGLVLAALLVVRPGAGGGLPSTIVRAICGGIGAGCAGGEGELALEPCPTRSRATDEGLGATVASVSVGRGDTALLEQRSDGTASVSFLDGGRAGMTGGLGVAFAVDRHTAALRAEGSVRGSFTAGRRYDFPTRHAAREFLERFRADEGLGGEARRLLAAACRLCRGLGLRTRSMPEPDVTYIEGGTSLDGSLSAGADTASARASVAGAAAEGRRIDHHTGEVTYYHRLASFASGALGEPSAGGSATVGAEGFIEYTTASDGTPLLLTVRRATSSTGLLRGMPERQVVTGPERQPRRLDLEEHVMRLDLTDPRNRGPAVALVDAVGDPLAAGRMGDMASAVADRFAADGRIDVRGYSRRVSRSAASADLAVGLKLGAEVTGGREVRRLTSAYTRPAGASTYFQRGDCVA